MKLDSKAWSRCYQWKLAEQCHTAFHDRSSNLNANCLVDQKRLCLVSTKMIEKCGQVNVVICREYFYDSNLCSNESARVLLYPESFRDPSCFKDGRESHGERRCPVLCDIKLVPDPRVELPERHPSE